MRYIRLVSVDDQFDTTPGLMIKGGTMPDAYGDDNIMADRDGILLAHDLLEHQNGLDGIGPIWDELQALGGLWFVRGRYGDFMTDRPSYYSPEYNVASDISRMWEDLCNCDYPEHETMLGRHKLNTRPHDYDEEFGFIIEEARSQIADMMDSQEDKNWAIDMRKRMLEASLHHLRIGFRKAERRYAKGGQYYATNMFRHVRDAVRTAHKMVEFEGQEFILGYSADGATVREVYLEDEY